MLSFILAITLQISFTQISLLSQRYGCTNNECTQLCKLGVADCSQEIPICEYGYFLFQQKYCVKCPGIFTNMRLECMDCNENPKIWETQRKCTYSYQIQNGDALNGVFQQVKEYQPSLYFIIQSTTSARDLPDRQVDLPFETSICDGCDQFCEDDSDESCNFLEEINTIDRQVGVKCLSGFYYDDGCQSCPKYCQSCTIDSCLICNKGFVLSDEGLCIGCQDGCLACYNGEIGLECSECSFTQLESYYIPSMFLDQCESCNGQCIRCEYMAYDVDPQYLTRNLDVPYDEDIPLYIKRCRQCKNGNQFIDSSGEECSPCNIEHCAQCYQDLGDGITTLTPDFKPKKGTFPTLCNKCQAGYKLSADKLSCTSQPVADNCQTFNSDGSCQQCQLGQMYDFATSKCTIITCSSKIQNCLDCFSYIEPDADIIYDSDGNVVTSNKQQLQCTKCATGFYADFFTGKCVPCDSHCYKCFQYTQSYNLTEIGQNYIVYSESQKLIYQNEDERLMCIQCNNGYDIYDGKCKGCGDGCTINSIPMCVFDYDSAYCSQCPAGQRSLTQDLTDCAECPQYCLACRPRTQDEINLINPLFNPSNDDFVKYSNLCYQKMSNLDPARNLYLDTITFMPTACDYPGTQQKCHHTATITVNLDCGSDDPSADAIILSEIFRGKSSIAKLLLKTVDTYQNYLLLNNNNVQEVNVIVNIAGGVCEFTKPTAFRTYLQQNVFSLMKLNIKFTSPSPVMFSQIGQIQFKNINKLEFENINFQYNYDAKTKIKDFGLIFLGKSSSFTLKKSTIDKQNSLSYSTFSFNLTGVQTLTFEDTTFNQLTRQDPFLDQNFTIETNYTLTLQNVKFSQCTFFDSKYLFAQNPLNYTIINIVSLTIYQSDFVQTNLFGIYTRSSNLLPQIQLNIDKLIIEISSFNNSNILVSNQIIKSKIQNVDIYQSQFIKSVIFNLNTINFKNFYVAQNKFYNSTAFMTSIEIDVRIVPKSALTDFTLSNINMESNQCNNVNCLFIFATPDNQYYVTANLVINSLQIQNTESSVDTDDIQYLNSAIAKFTSFQTIIVNQISSVNNLGMIVYYFNIIKSIEVNTLVCDYPQDDIVEVEDDEGEAIKIENPFLNKIPASEECGQQLKLTQKYNFFCMYIGQYTHGVKLTDVVIRNMLLYDFSAITIQSYDSLQMNTSRTSDSGGLFYSSYDCEVVIINQIQANNNTLIAYELGSTLSLISILSTQIQSINIKNAEIQSNHLHKLSKLYMLQCATAFLILSQQGTLTMSNLNFEYNRATQIEYGLNHIVVKSANIKNSNFISTNIFNGDWQAILSENQMDIVQIWQYFEVISTGANLYVSSQQLNIENCQFEESYGLGGSGIYAVTQGAGYINITSTTFSDISANLEPKYSTQGGGLYIDGTTAQLNLLIDNVDMMNCKSRISGGCMWVGTGKHQAKITIIDSSFIRCQSLTSQFMEVLFQDIFTQTVEMRQVIISNNKLIEFISEVPMLSQSEINQYKSTASVYTQNYGQLILYDVSFTKILYSGILRITNLYLVYFQDVLFTDNVIFGAPLVYITLQENGLVYFGSVMLVSNQEFTPKEYQIDCSALYYVAPQEDVILQTCDDWSYSVELVEAQFDDEFYIIEDLNSKSYKDMTDAMKYEWDRISNVHQDTFVIEPIESVNNIEVAECLLYYIYLELSNQTTAYVQIDRVGQQNYIRLEDVKISNNECERCVYGLFQMMDVVDSPQVNMIIKQLSCVNNRVSYFGCLSITNQKEFNEIEFNKPLLDERLLQEDNSNTTYSTQINNSYFQNNHAKIGGGLSIIGLNTLIQSCEFSNNNASIVGGGLFYSSMQSIIQIFNSLFQSNSAQVGAALYLEGTQLSNQTKCMNQYDHNVGQSVYENPIGMTLLLNGIKFATRQFNNYSEDGDVLSEKVNMIDIVLFDSEQLLNYPNSTEYLIVPSGQEISKYKYYLEETMEQIPYGWNLSLVYLNRFNEIVNGENISDQITIEGRIQNKSDYDAKKAYQSNFTSYSTIYYDVVQSAFDLSGLIITFDPYIHEDLYLELRILCNSVSKPVIQKEYPYNVAGENTNFYLLINIRTYPCQMGEIYVDQKCQACEQSLEQFNVVLNAKECKDVNANSMLAVTPVGIKLQKGWWRPYTDNDQIESCSHLPANCKGGWIPGNPSCYTGHIGALCESCDLYSQFNEIRYSNTEKYICSPCADTKDSSIGILIGNTLATVASITLSVKGTYELVNQFLMIKSLTLMGVRLNQNANNLATLIKMLTNYFQIIQILNTFQLIIPKGLSKTTDAAGNPTKASSFSLDCLLQPMTDINMLYFRMIWALVMPCVYLLIYFVQYFFGVLIGKIPYKAAMISTAFIYMFIFAQPTLVGGFIQLGSARQISGVSWVQADVAYRSDTSEHSIWSAAFVAPMIVVWVAVLPLLFLYRIYTYRFHLSNRHIRSRWGFFYNEYEDSAYYWEFVKIIEKMLMVIFLTFYEDYVLIKGTLVVLVLLYYSWIQNNSEPYQNGDLNYIDRFSTIVCITSLIIGLLIHTAQEYDTNYLIIIMFILLGIFNLIFLIQIVYMIFEGYLVKLSDKVDAIRDKVNAIKPNLRYQHPKLRKLLQNKKLMNERVNKLWGVLRAYTKQQIKNRRENLPKYEQILNAPYDFAAAKLPKEASATIIPVDEIPEYLNSGIANGAKILFQKVNEIQDLEKQEIQEKADEQTKDGKKKEEGFLGGLKQYMPKSVKDQMEKAEKKIEEAKKLKEQAENAVAKGKQLAGVAGVTKDKEEEEKQADDEKQQLKEPEQSKGGFFGQFSSLVPDSVTKQIKQAEEQKKLMEQRIQEAQNIKNKLEQQAEQIKDGTILQSMGPEQVLEEKKKLEEQMRQAQNQASQVQELLQKDPKKQIQTYIPTFKEESPESLISVDQQFQQLNEESIQDTFKIAPKMQITQSNFFQQDEKNK